MRGVPGSATVTSAAGAAGLAAAFCLLTGCATAGPPSGYREAGRVAGVTFSTSLDGGDLGVRARQGGAQLCNASQPAPADATLFAVACSGTSSQDGPYVYAQAFTRVSDHGRMTCSLDDGSTVELTLLGVPGSTTLDLGVLVSADSTARVVSCPTSA